MKITKSSLHNNEITIVLDENVLPGIKRIAALVAKDIEKVFGEEIKVIEHTPGQSISGQNIIVGVVGKSELLNDADKQNILNISDVAGKREVYSFTITENNIYIAGADKRGAIYGLFHVSEMLGVSPFVNWMNVLPDPKESYEFQEKDSFISKEPSVRYRGFFINDEWPAFGNWCEKNFGGFNSECYAQVFELLLRLKGNYMWPAMWSAIFSNDGPGLASAELADEMGVVMGMSHHEPCLRNGEEYRYLRGKDSVYGDAWNFRTNEAGITRFWEDGLKRSGKFENVITVGMRGEADSTIMGKDATLKDNIDLLRDVLKCQNRLIKENVNENLEEVPRMLALYKEVEPFYYGDENTEGLMNCDELEGVTLMLCDDNFGNLRTVPTQEMRSHKGGFGMYYHFDYHGWPISYEWINSSYLPKIWDQMTTAYEFGIRDLWIVNVGDIFTTEYPLSFFLDLAYDYDKWGINNINASREYTAKWVDSTFSGGMEKNQKKETENLLMGYTKIASARRPEAMNLGVYSVASGAAKVHSDKCEALMDQCRNIYESLSGNVKDTFFQTVFYPLMGNLNVQKMWTDCDINHYLADIGATLANEYGRKVKEALAFDKTLIDKLHSFNNGRWYGMGMSEHIGFRNWNEEECSKPVIYEAVPAKKPRIIAFVAADGQRTEGGDWTARRLTVHIDKANNKEANLYLLSASDMDATYEIQGENVSVDGKDVAPGISGVVKVGGLCKLKLALSSGSTGENKKGNICIHTQSGGNIRVDVVEHTLPGWKSNRLCIESDDFEISAKGRDGSEFIVLPEYGKFKAGIKVMPVTGMYVEGEGAHVTYRFTVPEEGKYTLLVHSTPTNPPYTDQILEYGVSVNDNPIEVVSSLPQGFKVGDDQDIWKTGVLENIRTNRIDIDCISGDNTITIWSMSPQFILQRLEVIKR